MHGQWFYWYAGYRVVSFIYYVSSLWSLRRKHYTTMLYSIVDQKPRQANKMERRFMLKRIGRWRRSVDVKTIAHYRYEGGLILFATHLALPKKGRYLSDLKSNSYLPTAPLSIVRPWCLLILVGGNGNHILSEMWYRGITNAKSPSLYTLFHCWILL